MSPLNEPISVLPYFLRYIAETRIPYESLGHMSTVPVNAYNAILNLQPTFFELWIQSHCIFLFDNVLNMSFLTNGNQLPISVNVCRHCSARNMIFKKVAEIQDPAFFHNMCKCENFWGYMPFLP
jgi:hypothetical protein